MTVSELRNLLSSLPSETDAAPVHLVTGDFLTGEQRWDAASMVTVGAIEALASETLSRTMGAQFDARMIVFIRGAHAELTGVEAAT